MNTKHKIRKKRSIFWTISTEELKEKIAKANSLSEIIREYGFSPSGNLSTLKRRLLHDQIDYSHIKIGFGSNKGRKFNTHLKTKDECLTDVFVKNSKTNRASVKKYIIRYNLIPCQCKCGLQSEWQGKKLILQLEHKNGIRNDNRLENLEFLCPNCHSQTETFSGRNTKRISIKYYCGKCKKEVTNENSLCHKCSGQNRRKIIRPDKVVLEKEIWIYPFIQLGKKYNVTDNAIKKWCKEYGIEKFPGRGYWQKIKSS